ncbi:MAG: hypothetical protein R3E96_05185 [Planctomycetota bacterium]
MYIGMSGGGVFEMNGGKAWALLIKGCSADFLPMPDPEYGHDPHCMVLARTNPDRIRQQNHCGIHVMDREEGTWKRVGRDAQKRWGTWGSLIVVSPFDPDTAWVSLMDGTDVQARTSLKRGLRRFSRPSTAARRGNARTAGSRPKTPGGRSSASA